MSDVLNRRKTEATKAIASDEFYGPAFVDAMMGPPGKLVALAVDAADAAVDYEAAQRYIDERRAEGLDIAAVDVVRVALGRSE